MTDAERAFDENEAEIVVAMLIVQRLAKMRETQPQSAVMKAALMNAVAMQLDLLEKSKTLSHALVEG